MRQVDWYIDTARDRLGATSDNDLARKIGFSREAISQWRTRRSWPTAQRMVRLAEVCGVDPHVALAELGTWREPDVAQWRALVDRLSGAAIAIVALFFIWPSGTPASAGTMVERPAAAVVEGIHYATIARRLVRAVAAFFRALLDPATADMALLTP